MIIFCNVLHFFSLVWLHWALSWIIQRIRMSSYNYGKKCYIRLNIWANRGKKWPKICWSMLYVVTNNAILQKQDVYCQEINNWKPNKTVFLRIYTLYTLRKMFSQTMPWYSKHYKNLVIFVILGRFSSFFFLFNVVRMDSSIGFSKN